MNRKVKLVLNILGIHPSNIIHIIAGIIIFIYFIIPTIDWVEDKFREGRAIDETVVVNQTELMERLEYLEKQNKLQMSQRKSGVVGYTAW